MTRFGFKVPRPLRGLLPACYLLTFPATVFCQEIVLESVQVEPVLDGATIRIKLDQPFTFVTYTLTDPDRLVVDLVDTDIKTSLPVHSSVDAGLVKEWELSPGGDSSKTDGVDYLSFLLTRSAQHRIESTDGWLVIRVRPEASSSAGTEILEDLASFSLRPTGTEPSLTSSGPWNLDGVLEFGLSRHRPVQIAREEVELAQLKVREARRALYPTATLKASWTSGAASNVDFTETSHGLQIEQPLYYSGRLLQTYRQSLVNLQVAEKRQSKVKSDFALEIAQAYYQLVGAQKTLGFQQKLVEEANGFLKKTKARSDEGLLTRLELLNVQAQVNQAMFQRATAENDVTLAKIKLLARLSLDPNTTPEIPSELPSQTPIRVDLEEVLQLAAQYRPDLQLNSLLVEFHEYEERIAKLKGKLKVDLSGFIGASGSAFETEPLDLGEDYFVGIKAARALGPHGVTLSSTTTKTSPRLGQTTRTDSTVYSGELGLLNQLSGLSEVQQAVIGLAKARNDLEEAKATVFQEVQESYISYAKALLQLEYVKERIAFREEQVKILETQASLNEAPPSQVLEAIVKVTEERVAQVQALTNYQVALAKLNKAIGLPGHYR